jgi:hypothetical protein
MEKWQSMVIYTYDSSIWEAAAGELQVYLSYVLRHCQEMKKGEQEGRGREGREEKQEKEEGMEKKKK